MKKILMVVAIIVVICVVGLVFVKKDKPTPSNIVYKNATTDMIQVSLPYPGAVTGKEFSVIGKARGNWYFEASFPIEVLDKDGKTLARGIAKAQGDWMTTEFVPFKADIKIPESYIGTATLILKKDNPSGLPEHDASISLTIKVVEVDPSWLLKIQDNISFRYPGDLGTKYIHTVDWPPKVEASTTIADCTMKKNISSTDYCVSVESEGAAGSTYNQYTYSKILQGKTMILNFTTRQPQCDNYDDPQKTECKNERDAFNVDALADKIMKTIKIN